jgi:hypothetical protein
MLQLEGPQFRLDVAAANRTEAGCADGVVRPVLVVPVGKFGDWIVEAHIVLWNDGNNLQRICDSRQPCSRGLANPRA